MADSGSETFGALGIVDALDVRVPMRDGVRLSTNLFRPDAPGRFPVLLLRTPYNKGAARWERFVRAGYVVATQDLRGRYASEGEFTSFLEQTKDGEDGYDTIEWLAAQPFSDGNVGTFGVSYPAWVQWQAARLRPPHLKAMSAVSIPTDLPALDFTGGAFRPARRINWWLAGVCPDVRRREGGPLPHTPGEARAVWHDIDRGKWLFTLPWTRLPREQFGSMAEAVFDWFRHPWEDPWRFLEAHREVEVPNLDFTGWYDHCCGIGHHLNMRRVGRTAVAREQQKIVIGPWNHVGLGARKIGEIDFGPDAQVNIEDLQIRWFDHWLKGIRNGVDEWAPVRYFVMGSGAWKASDTWPPAGTAPLTLHLGAGGVLDEETRGDEATDEYVYDPADPVMTFWGPELFTVPSDRSRLAYRPDIVRYETPPLASDLEVAGYPEVVLFASSSARDTDFFARLVDVHPDGRAIDVCQGMVRARYREGLRRPRLLEPGEVVEYRITLGPTACRFAAGHRVQLEITSSDFPNYDRNHNTGRDDFSDAELVPARQAIHHSARRPSRLILPVA